MEVEKCEFNGQQLRFVTGRTRDQAGSRKLARLTFLPLPAGTYEKRAVWNNLWANMAHLLGLARASNVCQVGTVSRCLREG